MDSYNYRDALIDTAELQIKDTLNKRYNSIKSKSLGPFLIILVYINLISKDYLSIDDSGRKMERNNKMLHNSGTSEYIMALL